MQSYYVICYMSGFASIYFARLVTDCRYAVGDICTIVSYLINVIDYRQMPKTKRAEQAKQPRQRGTVRQRVWRGVHEWTQVYRARFLPL